MVELGEESKEQATQQAHRLMHRLNAQSNPPTMKLFVSDEDQGKIWQVREAGLGATAFVPGGPVTWEGWEDSAVPSDKVGPYLRELCKLYEKYNYRSAMYGHFGQGCIHCRLNFDLQTSAGINKWRAFMEEATDLVTTSAALFPASTAMGNRRQNFCTRCSAAS